MIAMTTIYNPDQIDAARLLTLRQMLRLEMLGMTKKGRSAYSILKSEFGFKGSRETVFKALTEWRNQVIAKA
jgi:hypothetical protein